MDLNTLRLEIDRIDRQLVEAFLARMEVSAAIGDYKKQRGLPVYVPAREEEKLRQLETMAPGMEADIRALYETIFRLSRDYQTRRSYPFGLLGRSLSHSYSPRIHSLLGNPGYGIYEREPEDVERFVKEWPFRGINVTIPYKKTVLPFCHELSPTAKALGAVNTLVRREDGTLFGHNTDVFGFRSLLERLDVPLSGKKVLVLGSGGASVTAVAVLESLGARPVVISRSGENNYNNLALHRDAALMVNATPVGMYPHIHAAPLSLKDFPKLEGVADMVYNPARTKLLLEAEELGIPHVNGLWMLVAQAWESAGLFAGKELPRELMGSVYEKLRRETENIVLIGMPGCGKSTIAALLSQKLGRPWVDADEAFEKETGLSPAQYLQAHGEAPFRAQETKVLEGLCKDSGQIIATGGGCVTIPENRGLLRCNGKVFWLLRDISRLSTEGRPLSQKYTPQALYQAREPLYRQYADEAIDNNGAPEAAAQRIMEALT